MPDKRFNFTIIELLVSISIIAILFAMLMPAFSESKEKARFARWLHFNKQCSSDPRCVINLNFQEGNGKTVLKNSAQGFEEEGFSADNYSGNLKGNYEWTYGRWKKNKKAIQFDGASTYIEFDKSKYVDFGNGSDYTIMAWVKCDNDNGVRGLFGQYDLALPNRSYSAMLINNINPSGTTFIGYTFAANGIVIFYNRDTNGARVALDYTQWFQLTMRNKTANGTTTTSIFINDKKLDALTLTNSFYTYTGTKPTHHLTLGALPRQDNTGKNLDPRYFFKGKMDEFIIYSRALKDKEIKGHYEMGNIHAN